MLTLSADVLLSLLLPAIILLHLLIAPYTKVEESFNLQATYDLVHHSPLSDIENFDHVTFPGAVPRTFLGALSLAVLAKPILFITNTEYSVQYAQTIVRAVLGLLNGAALIRYKNGLEESFGVNIGRWFVLLLTTQFHVVYYASRTLPNMFAFVLSKSSAA
jgi:alpha-1,6-mannosyltransferase